MEPPEFKLQSTVQKRLSEGTAGFDSRHRSVPYPAATIVCYGLPPILIAESPSLRRTCSLSRRTGYLVKSSVTEAFHAKPAPRSQERTASTSSVIEPLLRLQIAFVPHRRSTAQADIVVTGLVGPKHELPEQCISLSADFHGSNRQVDLGGYQNQLVKRACR